MSLFENKTIYIKFLFKDKSLPKRHPLYGGKHEKASVTLSAPHFEGKPKKIFTNSELEELQKQADEDLSFRKDNEFWRSGITQFALPKEGLKLELTNWIDVIRYRIATDEIYKDLIGQGETYSPLCKYAVFTDEEESEAVKMSDKRFDNIKFYGKYEDNADVLRYIYFTCVGGRVAVDEKLIKLQKRVKGLLETEPIKVNKVSKEKNLEEKGMLLTGHIMSIVDKTGTGYMLGGNKLYKGNQGTFEQAAEFLADNLNQELKFELQGKIEASK